jgi:23S rRNA (cytidine1920-2'-O)/16S rRNA (cytidine1409-2'-O)-methyltransferase
MNNASDHQRLRLDQLLVDTGAFASRSRARDAIQRGTVRVGGKPVAKPGQLVARDAAVEFDDPARKYVSRAALKLVAGLGQFGLSPEGKAALDIGASTGGFTQVMLEAGATHVYAIDVGHGQMAKRIAGDDRVTSIEGLNARDLAAEHMDGHAPSFIVSDVSFISLKLALPPALLLAAPGAEGIFLVKPQFEAGRERVGKGGIVSPGTAQACAADLAEWLSGQPGWSVIGVHASPITGGDGNIEFLLAGRKA